MFVAFYLWFCSLPPLPSLGVFSGIAQLGLCHEDSVNAHVASAEATEGRAPSGARCGQGRRAPLDVPHTATDAAVVCSWRALSSKAL